MKVDTIQKIVIQTTCQKTTPEENNDTVEEIMNQIKMLDTQETRAQRMVDTNQENLDQIKHLEKKFCL